MEGWPIGEVERRYESMQEEIQPFLRELGATPPSMLQREQLETWYREADDLYTSDSVVRLIAEGAKGVNEDLSDLLIQLEHVLR